MRNFYQIMLVWGHAQKEDKYFHLYYNQRGKLVQEQYLS
jgi:hypothetical protein